MSAIGFNGKLYGQEPSVSQRLLDASLILTVDGWTLANGVYQQTISVAGMPNTVSPVIVYAGDTDAAFNAYLELNDCKITEANKMVFVAGETKPTTDIPIIAKGVLANKYNAVQDLKSFSDYGLVTLGDESEDVEVAPNDADTFGGYEPSHYATATALGQVNESLGKKAVDVHYDTNFGSFYAVKRANVVTLTSWATAKQSLSTSNMYGLIGILPDGYKPSESLLTIVNFGKNTSGQIRVDADGKIYVGYTFNSFTGDAVNIASGEALYFTFTYVM